MKFIGDHSEGEKMIKAKSEPNQHSKVNGPKGGAKRDPAQSDSTAQHLGVGIDTARYGHHVTFLRDDKQPAAAPLSIMESRSGYERLRSRLEALHRRHPTAHIHVRIDAAGQYAANLEVFVRSLEQLPMTVSVGEPKRNKDYHRAHSPKRKSDSTESFAMARYAVVERPKASHGKTPEFAALRRVASRLQNQTKQTTRLTNQMHETLSAAFPELATMVSDITRGWVLKMLQKYPTAKRIASARISSLEKIPFLKPEMAAKIHKAAKSSVGTLSGEVAEALILELVSELRHSLQEEQRWKELLTKAFDALPDGPHRQITSIKGIGKHTAAAIVATAVSIDRFPTAKDLVGYYGVFPEELQSGVDKLGRPIPPGKKTMCHKGNDLVRGLLWQCAKCASGEHCGNPAVRELYLRRLAAGNSLQVAWGYCMTKLLRQVFGVWTTGTAFDPQHESNKKAETSSPKDESSTLVQEHGQEVTEAPASLEPVSKEEVEPLSRTAHLDDSQAKKQVESNRRPIDYGELRDRVSFAQILDHVGQPAVGVQHRGPCPLHEPDVTNGHSFSVNLKRNIFRCFHRSCAAKGNVLDFWSSYKKLELYEAAQDMAQTFSVELPYLESQQPCEQHRKHGGHQPPST